MPPRSRTKPGTTARRPRVAGLRQNTVAAPEETTETDAPDAGITPTATATTATAAPPRATPAADAPAPAPEAPHDRDVTSSVAATPTDAATTAEADAPAAVTPEDTPTADTATTPAVVEPPTADVAPTEAIPAADATTTTVSAPATDTATTETSPGTADVAPEENGGDAATTRTATPTPTAKPRPTGGASRGGTGERSSRRKSGGSLTPNPSAGATGTAVKERPTRTRPEPEPAREPGRLGRAGRAMGGAFGRFGRSRRALPITMVVVIVVCLVLSGLAFWKGREAWTSGPVSNQAVIDVGGTAEIVGQTRESIEKIFSYDFTKLDDSVEAARTMSTGAFTDQYLAVFDRTIRTPAMQQQLRQTATVVNIGVNSIRDDRAQVMALVQFNAQRTSTGESTNAPGLLRLDMQRVDGRWKLTQLTPLTAPR